MRRRLRIGLTGGIASGKSTVAQRFRELGVPVIDADESARRVVAAGTAGLAEVIRQFGRDILGANGELDRRRLRTVIFSDPKRRLELESILHPLIRADMERGAESAVGPYVVMAIPLLIEGGNNGRVDRILVIDLPEALQLERVMTRDDVPLAEAKAILAVQASRDQKLQAADDVLTNTGTLADLHRAVDDFHTVYLRLASGT